MQPGDEVGAELVWDRAARAMRAAHHLPDVGRGGPSIERTQRRMRHLRGTDPDGSWIAVSGDDIIGVAQAHLRGSVWVLATLGVAPGWQDQGIGRDLMERALGYGDRASSGAIFASPDPRAMHRYVSAGFELHPIATAFGEARGSARRPSGIREGSADDLERTSQIDRMVRGTDRGTDLAFLLDTGSRLLVDEDGGYAVVDGGRVAMLSALDEDVATGLLLATVAECPLGEPVEVDWITARQQWAIRALNRLGVPLQIHQSIMMRGAWQPESPYLPHGIFG